MTEKVARVLEDIWRKIHEIHVLVLEYIFRIKLLRFKATVECSRATGENLGGFKLFKICTRS